MDIDALLSELTIAEKCSLLSGDDFWHTKAIPRLGIPSIRMSDGPNGVRGTTYFHGTRAACFPCGTALGATWDTELIQHAGELMGQEAIAKGASVLLGPTVNIQRSPLGGRGFESFSEDPVLSGMIAAAIVRGIQNTGVIATIKHFVCNDQEHDRQGQDSVVSDRALREIYMMPFQIAERDAKPKAYMTSYNKVNGKHASESEWLINGILRQEWGFDGVVMSDWWGTYSTVDAITAGLDIEMPGPSIWRDRLLTISIAARKITTKTIDMRVRKVLELLNRVAPLHLPERAEETTIDTPETTARLLQIGAQGIVLAKNEGNVLPFCPNKTTAIIGPNAKFTAYSGGGSAKLAPYRAICPFEGLRAHSKHLQYELGCVAYKKIPLLSAISQTSAGTPGVECRVYIEPPEKKSRVPVETMILNDTDCFLDGWSHPQIKSTLYWMEVEGVITAEMDGEYIFSLAVNGTAKLFVNGTQVVDNTENQRPGDSFFGMGTQEETGTYETKQGSQYKILVQYGTAPTSTRNAASGQHGAGGLRIGCTRKTNAKDLLDTAVELARRVDQVVLCIGLTYEWESEGSDRDNISLPPGTDDLVTAVCAANRNVAVVNQSGTPVAMPWINQSPAVLQAWFGGNETGNAIGDVIFGKISPSGKMPITWPKRAEDNPAFLNYRSENGKVLYGEGVYVGYRFFEKVKTDVLFPFGHGLSYSKFKTTDFNISDDGQDRITAFVTICNTGSIAAAEVIQLYVTQLSPSIQRPLQELKGFKKVFLEPGENKRVEIVVSKKYATSYWDEQVNSFIMEKGIYEARMSTCSTGEKLVALFEVGQTLWWKGL